MFFICCFKKNRIDYYKPVNRKDMEKLFQKGVVVDLSNLVDYSAGGVVSKQIVKSAAGNITLFSFDKGEGLSEHTAPFDALVQILEGEMEIVVDGNHSRMKAGESLVLPANVPHALTAVQRFKMLLTMIKE
ncbi:cupin domain-containing protein [Parabacteroides goldsteinii]|jgi:quercetin dioxygenase-like cupin family protein